MVPGHGVGAVDDGVDHRLQPGVPRYDVHGPEGSVPPQGATPRRPLLDEGGRLPDDVSDGPLDAAVAVIEW